MLQSRSSCSIEPRPSRANSLLLDLLELPLAAADPNSDMLLKCELDSVLSNEHDTPTGAQQRIFPLPYGREHIPDSNKQSQDLQLPAEAVSFPAALFTSTTSAATSASRPSSTISTLPSLVVQRGGRTSQFSAKQRRERHNANERRRTNAAKDRVRDMRDTVTRLEERRVELAAQRDANAAANEVLPHRRPLHNVVPRECFDGKLGYSIPGSSTYLDLAQSVDGLRNEKRYLEEQLDQLDSQNSALQAMQAELVIDVTSSVTVTTAKKGLKRKREEANGFSCKRLSSDETEITMPPGGYCMETEAVPSYLKVLFSKPMTSDAAFDWVKDSYGDIMDLKAQQKNTNAVASSFLGWREDKRDLIQPKQKDGECSLELMMTQNFPGMVSGELVFHTWNLLTLLKNFKKLFPLTKDLAVLQMINDDCLVVRIGLAPNHETAVVHSIVVLARGQIDGGYLVSMRSVPLSAGQKAFADNEQKYFSVLAWFMLLDKFDENAQPVCEVIVGASTQHKSQRVLRRVATDFVAGAVRWQEAVSRCSHWLF
ncbi:hypothetical protein CCR75_008247 [Bremia lactucae]|uniref:BZIP domain-containing protein n=1 Tax=Bremia lactucae TaxID=4779 RepID=A0A976FQS9_BRELC|nr:hypothetical protein CCR75_008247 [Bremia lactucae]